MLARNRMQFDEADKENIANVNFGQNTSGKLFGKKGDLDKKENIAGRFGRLLNEASSEKRDEEDNLYAIDQQAEEAVAVLSEWLQESQDFKLAQELAEALQKEHDSQRRLQLIQGESEALKVAVEEKRRLKALSQAKLDREREDEAMAKKFADEEVHYIESKLRQFEEDEKYSLALLEEEDRIREVERERIHEDDAKYCYELQQAEEEAKLGATATTTTEEKADYKGHHQQEDDEKANYYEDEEKEHEVERCFVAEDKHIMSPPSKASHRNNNNNNKRDDKLTVRAQYQLKKRQHYAKMYEHHSNKGQEEYLAALWEQANAEVDDVAGAVCLSLLLPNVCKLQVKVDRKESLVRIDAKRWMVHNNSNSSKDDDHSHYVAEFVLSGQRIDLSSDKVYHDYSPDTGILFIYVEDMCLDLEKQQTQSQPLSAQQAKEEGSSMSAGGNGSNGSRIAHKQNILNKMKNNFLRIFNSNNNNSHK